MSIDTLTAERDFLRLQLRDVTAQRDQARAERDRLLARLLPPADVPAAEAADLAAVRRVAALAQRCGQLSLMRRLNDLEQVMSATVSVDS